MANKNVRLSVILLFLFIIPSIKSIAGKSKNQQSPVVNLSNSNAKLTINLQGAAIIDFELKSKPLNPFSWKLTTKQMPVNNQSGAVFQGHFLCLGRWGAPTKGEMKAGVPHNGQASRDLWTLLATDKTTFLKMAIKAPLDGVMVEREVSMDKESAVFKVTEKVTNSTSVGRLFNVVQHATIAPPFIDSTTIINSNAKQGFLQSMSYPNPAAHVFVWPAAYSDSLHTPLDLTRSDSKLSYVSSHIFADSIGWVTASTPHNGLLLGYYWKTKEYPWLNLWHQLDDGKLWAKGLEFGTAGIGQSYQDLLRVDTRFHGKNSFFFLDAKETVIKSYVCFLMPIPVGFKGVKQLYIRNKGIEIIEDNQNETSYVIQNSFK